MPKVIYESWPKIESINNLSAIDIVGREIAAIDGLNVEIRRQ